MQRLGPGRELGQHLRAADQHLDRDRARPRSAPAGRSRGWSRWVRHATTATTATIAPTTAATQRWSTCAEVSVGQLAAPAIPPMSGQSGKISAALGRGDVRAEEQQREGRGRGERGEDREPLAGAAPADAGREAGTDRDVDQQPDQGHRRGQVRGHRLAGVAEADRLAAEPRLEPDEEHGQRASATGSTGGRGGRGGPGSAMPRISKPTITATPRWIHSIQALASSSGGRIWPWQSGQSGQPSPESVARTMTPIVTSASVVSRVARARRWKRVTRSPFYRPGRRPRSSRADAAPGTRTAWLSDRRYPSAMPRPRPIAAAAGARPVRRGLRRLGRVRHAGPERLRQRRRAVPERARGDRDAGRLGRPGDRAGRAPVSRQQRGHVRPGAAPAAVPRQPEPRRRARRTGRPRSRSTTWAATPRSRSSTADGTFIWTIPDDRGMYIFDVALPEAGTWGAEVTTAAPGPPTETSG